MTTKIWPATDAEAAACTADPDHINKLFHAAGDDCALIHGWRGDVPADARPIVGASDVTRFLAVADLARIVACRNRGEATPWDAVFAICTEAANRVEIIDIARAAIAAGAGLMFCTFEDW